MMEEQLALLKSMSMEQKTSLINNMKEITELLRVCIAKKWIIKPGVEATYIIKKRTKETERVKVVYNDMTLGGVVIKEELE